VQYLVIGRGIDAALMPAQVEIQLVLQTHEQFRDGAHPEIKQVFSFGGERGGALLVEVDGPDQLEALIGRLPLNRLVQWEIHALCSLDARLASLRGAAESLQRSAPPGPPPAGPGGLTGGVE
jgi:hypothetical protein